jgi:hypothetical protein
MWFMYYGFIRTDFVSRFVIRYSKSEIQDLGMIIDHDDDDDDDDDESIK